MEGIWGDFEVFGLTGGLFQVLPEGLGDLRPQREHQGDLLEPAEHPGAVWGKTGRIWVFGVWGKIGGGLRGEIGGEFGGIMRSFLGQF